MFVSVPKECACVIRNQELYSRCILYTRILGICTVWESTFANWKIHATNIIWFKITINYSLNSSLIIVEDIFMHFPCLQSCCVSVPKECACVIRNLSAKQCTWLSHARPAPFPFPLFLFPALSGLNKCLFLWIYPLFFVSKKCASQFCRETTQENKQFKWTKTYNSYLIRQSF